MYIYIYIYIYICIYHTFRVHNIHVCMGVYNIFYRILYNRAWHSILYMHICAYVRVYERARVCLLPRYRPRHDPVFTPSRRDLTGHADGSD